MKIDPSGNIQIGGVDFYVHGQKDGSADIEIEAEGSDDHGHFVCIELDDLEQFVNAAREYLGQPVLADEVMLLRYEINTWLKHPLDTPFPGLIAGITKAVERVSTALRAMGKLE